MKRSLVLFCATAITAAHVFAVDATPAPEKKPGIMNRILHPFGGRKPAAEPTPAPATEKKPGIMHRVLHPFGGGKEGAGKKNKNLAVALKLSPQPLKLSATNRLNVTLTLINFGKKLVPLEFPTSQRIEVLIKDSTGKTIEQWSQDQAFTNDPTVVTVNSGERAEYSVEVATRELSAGQRYTVEGFIPAYNTLRAEQSFVPEK